MTSSSSSVEEVQPKLVCAVAPIMKKDQQPNTTTTNTTTTTTNTKPVAEFDYISLLLKDMRIETNPNYEKDDTQLQLQLQLQLLPNNKKKDEDDKEKATKDKELTTTNSTNMINSISRIHTNTICIHLQTC